MNNLKMRRKRAFVKAKLFKIASVYLFTKTEYRFSLHKVNSDSALFGLIASGVKNDFEVCELAFGKDGKRNRKIALMQVEGLIHICGQDQEELVSMKSPFIAIEELKDSLNQLPAEQLAFISDRLPISMFGV